MQALLLFSYLQVLDGMSTLVFLMLGVGEANPVVKFAFSLGPNPVAGLLLVKIVAVLLGIYCWRLGRGHVLRAANLLFAFLVAWNLIAITVQVAQIV